MVLQTRVDFCFSGFHHQDDIESDILPRLCRLSRFSCTSVARSDWLVSLAQVAGPSTAVHR